MATATYVLNMRKGAGLGLVALAIVMLVVLLLAARQWRSVAPTAAQLRDDGSPSVVDTHGETGAAAAIRSGGLPDLREARQQTDAHAAQLEEALAEID